MPLDALIDVILGRPAPYRHCSEAKTKWVVEPPRSNTPFAESAGRGHEPTKGLEPRWHCLPFSLGTTTITPSVPSLTVVQLEWPCVGNQLTNEQSQVCPVAG